MSFRNEFSWSKSRNAVFTECERKYVLHYYTYWGGWQDQAPEDNKRLYKLRALNSYPAWVGIVVHDTITWMLQYMKDGGKTPPLSKVIGYARARLASNWEFSSQKRYWSERKAKNPDWFGLVEHELGAPLSTIAPERAWLKAATNLANLYESDVMARILDSDREKWLRIDERSYFNLDGIKIWSVPDFMFTRRDGVTEIVDWKTGKQYDDDMQQLAAYAAFARIEHDIPLDTIQATLAYLNNNPVIEVTAPATQDMIRSFATNARAGMAAMTKRLEQQGNVTETRQANIALPITEFAKTDETYKCARCNFRDECWPAGVPAFKKEAA